MIENLDALLPPQMAEKAEDIGVRKAKLEFVPLIMLAVLAGAFIALGALFSTTVVTGTAGAMPFGIVRLLSGLVFCLGLILVIVGGAELFTGNTLLVMAFVSRKITMADLLRNWSIVYAGNFIGAALTALFIFWTGQYRMADGAIGMTAINIAAAKCTIGWFEGVMRGIYANVLVCLAVWLSFSGRTTTDKILAIVFPITAFVAAGFEHCVANMYYVPLGLFLKAEIAAEGMEALTWGNFIVANLIPVTIGNVIGGSVFVGAVYWLVYRRGVLRDKG